MPDQRPVSVRSAEDVYYAVREAVLADARRLTLYCPGEVLWQAEPDPFSNLLGQCAVKQYQYRGSGRLYERKNFLNHIDTVSKYVYNENTDTVSASKSDEGLNHEKSYSGADHSKKGRNHQRL